LQAEGNIRFLHLGGVEVVASPPSEVFMKGNMKIKKSLIEKYNNRENLIVISSYPRKGELYSGNVGGIASFAKNTVMNMDQQVVVIAESFGRKGYYEEGKSLVIRAFERNRFAMWLQILAILWQFRKTRKVLFQFDFALYGDMVVSALALPFLFTVRILGFDVSIVVHSIVTDVFNLTGHLGLNTGLMGRIKGHILNAVFRLFYRLLGFAVEKVIVNDESLKRKLSSYISEEKIAAIPHGTDISLGPVRKKRARKILGYGEDEQVVLYFGFVNWFKGADLFVSSFAKITKLAGKKVRFIMAGGESATLSQKSHYRTYFVNLYHQIEQSENIELTGFVPQSKLALYFSAADLVVFPYRALIGASGALSLAFSYKKPFILSERLAPMLRSVDCRAAMKRNGLTEADFTFHLSNQACVEKTRLVLLNGAKQKLSRLAGQLRRERNWQYTSRMFTRLIYAADAQTVEVPIGQKKAYSFAESEKSV